jgi:hypothetical protein
MAEYFLSGGIGLTLLLIGLWLWINARVKGARRAIALVLHSDICATNWSPGSAILQPVPVEEFLSGSC